MFRPLEIFVGLRYLRARRRNAFVSFISLISMLGIGVGVAALIVVLSVMNGFEGELRSRLLSLSAHATVSGANGSLEDWQELVDTARRAPGVTGAAPYIQLDGMLASGPALSGVRVRGVDPRQETEVSEVAGHMLEGDLATLGPGSHHIVIGRALALMLGVRVGDHVDLLIPRGAALAKGIQPRLHRFTVSGVFEIGIQEADTALALISLEDAAALAGFGDRVSGVRLRYADVFAAPAGVAAFAQSLDRKVETSDWTVENATYFRAIRIEKTMMTLILFLIVAVAAFNIIATLVMVVTDKRTDIAILRTVGLAPRRVVGVFMTQGIVIGWLGTALGLALGIALALNVETIVPQLEALFGFQIMPSDVYYITRIPSDMQADDVITIGTVAFVLTVLATIYPSLRAARTEPAEALRYE
ncbi:MAG: lipoprotein-releasing ABC transporter permease subunit [Gammaproteobacteria bacterium]